jgi:hypothetical protein
MSMKNSDDTIRNQTHNLPARSAVPQPTAPPCAPSAFSIPEESNITFPIHKHTTMNTPPSSLHVRKLTATRSQSVSVYLPYHMASSQKIATLTKDIIKVPCNKDV